MQKTSNLRISEVTPITPPWKLKEEMPISDEAVDLIVKSRNSIDAILNQQDPRLLVVIGPCSIHDPIAAVDYAKRLLDLREKYLDRLFIVMRVYFEKPRTTVGWKGLINDPYLDGSCDIDAGLRMARKLLLEINDLGMPAATELLDNITPQYISDLISWTAIGARTTESQLHREMASGLSMPVGFKNATDGSIQVAMDAMMAASHPHSFVGIDEKGVTSIVKTKGNLSTHVVLRGGRARTNYDAESIADAVTRLKAAGLRPDLMVDCSHANSEKQHMKQEQVWQSVVRQRAEGNRNLTGIMVESNLEEGAQKFPQSRSALKYGVSITDACLGWKTTESILEWGYQQLQEAIPAKSVAA
ncbi:MAG: 3-deoxy-7-phosphoheptulonate synthase [Verrucomicrobiota bacterium]